MKAFVFEKYGSPDLMKMREVDTPKPGDDQVLVKVKASSVNPYDLHHIKGKIWFMRLMFGLFKPKKKIRIMGADVAGEIAEIGKNIKHFKVGDEVFGEVSYGTFAEYVCGNENTVVHKASNQSMEEAAAAPMTALTALQGLRDGGKIKAGQKVLINGASGGIGTYAVQMAKYFGTEVVGVCSGKNKALVLSLGADGVIDYTSEDVMKDAGTYDLVIDNVGNLNYKQLKGLLKQGGIAVVLGVTTLSNMFGVMIKGALFSKSIGKSIVSISAKIRKDDLELIRKLIEDGHVKTVLDKTYPFEEIPEALKYVDTRRAKGKVVINI